MARQSRRVLKCDRITLEVLAEYKNPAEAARALGLPFNTVRHSCDERRVGFRPYVLRYEDEYDPEESYEGKRGRPLAVHDTESGDTLCFYGPGDAAAALFVCECSITRAAKTGRRVLGRYAVTYAR